MRRGPLLVAAGAALGGPARHLVDLLVGGAGQRGPQEVGGTLLVNLVGALLLGTLVMWAGRRRALLLLLGTGFLGAFTTFGTLVLQAFELSDGGRSAAAAGYVAASLLLGVTAAWCGTVVGRRLPGAGTVEPDPGDPR